MGACTHPNKANGVACGNHAPEGECDQPDQCLNGQRDANRKAGGRTADSGAPSVFFILHPSPQEERARRPRQRSARAPARARDGHYLPPVEAVRVTGALSTDNLPAGEIDYPIVFGVVAGMVHAKVVAQFVGEY